MCPVALAEVVPAWLPRLRRPPVLWRESVSSAKPALKAATEPRAPEAFQREGWILRYWLPAFDSQQPPRSLQGTFRQARCGFSLDHFLLLWVSMGRQCTGILLPSDGFGQVRKSDFLRNDKDQIVRRRRGGARMFVAWECSSCPSSSLGTRLSAKLRFVGVEESAGGIPMETLGKQSFQDKGVTKQELGHEGSRGEGSREGSRTRLVLYVNPELQRLRALVDAARARLAELEAGFTAAPADDADPGVFRRDGEAAGRGFGKGVGGARKRGGRAGEGDRGTYGGGGAGHRVAVKIAAPW